MITDNLIILHIDYITYYVMYNFYDYVLSPTVSWVHDGVVKIGFSYRFFFEKVLEKNKYMIVFRIINYVHFRSQN